MFTYSILIDGELKCYGVTGKDAVVLMNTFAQQDDGTEEVSAVLECSTVRSYTAFEPREVR